MKDGNTLLWFLTTKRVTGSYDLVDHGTLLLKIQSYNFSRETIQWFSSYLSNRSFSTRIEASTSEPRELGAQGVPQGSILGSLLFVTSQGDLPGPMEGKADQKQQGHSGGGVGVRDQALPAPQPGAEGVETLPHHPINPPAA